jgi:GalNAc-alpha-(1->4)-GalNAc-alpha-(1->3)-diNAcBac-PP-undecaprenol alpha-1,4-N-acetyl-D-galactosaminyltransferase
MAEAHREHAARSLRIVLAISSLGAGGAERVMSVLAGALADRGHTVTLLTLANADSDFFPVGAGVARIALGGYRPSNSWLAALRANAQRVRAVRRAILRCRAQVVISFLTDMNIVSIIACLGLPVAVVVSERVDPRAHAIGALWSGLRRLTYPRAAVLVVQTESVAAWFRTTHARPARIAVIPNPVFEVADVTPAPARSRTFLFAAGRLTHQKGFDLLIRALALLVARGSELELVIAGEGPEHGRLAQLAEELGLSSRVRLIGRVQNLSGWMTAAAAFLLPSRYEGFPNVLVEALACGAAVVAADCPSGPREILRDGRYGLLVPCEDPQALAGAVLALEHDETLRARLRREAPEAVDRYRLPAVVSQWESLVRAVSP